MKRNNKYNRHIYYLLLFLFTSNIMCSQDLITKIKYIDRVKLLKQKGEEIVKGNLYKLYHRGSDSITVSVNNEIVFTGKVDDDMRGGFKLLFSFYSEKKDFSSKIIKIVYHSINKYALINWSNDYNLVKITPALFSGLFDIELVDVGKGKIPTPKKTPCKKEDFIIVVLEGSNNQFKGK